MEIGEIQIFQNSKESEPVLMLRISHTYFSLTVIHINKTQYFIQSG